MAPSYPCSRPDRLLIVDDDEANRDLLSRRLEGRGYAVDIAPNCAEAMEKLRRAQYDLVLLDQNIPGRSSLDMLRLLRATYSPADLPVIMVTSQDQGGLGELPGPADRDPIQPANLLATAARIQSELSRARSEREARESELRFDSITGLGNRLHLVERYSDRIATFPQAPAILLLDLDGFKAANDSYGFAIGNRVLTEMGARLGEVVSDAGLVARTGGGEFGVLLEQPCTRAAAIAFAEMILAEASRPIRIDGHEIAVSPAIGIVMEACGAADEMLRDAGLAMQRAKELDEHRWHIFEPQLRDRARTRMQLINELRRAADAGELVVYYQPEVNLKTRRISGFEALLRWRHPRRGTLSPQEFIPLAEETGLIVPIGEWALRQSCRQLRQWQKKFPQLSPLTMNVNLSVRQLSDPALVGRVRRILAETGLPPRSLNLELTESALISDIDASRDTLNALLALQVGLALDDFGTGYSSLACLRALHFDALKIDKSFVSKMMTDPDAHVIVDSVIRLAHALEMSVVAEGIEEERQIDELSRLGCDVGQGFHFSRAVPADQAEALLAAN